MIVLPPHQAWSCGAITSRTAPVTFSIAPIPTARTPNPGTLAETARRAALIVDLRDQLTNPNRP